MNNKSQGTISNTALSNEDYNSLSAVEQVYPAEIIDCTESINNVSELSAEAFFDPQQEAANDAFAYADIYSLNSARMAKHDRASERRASKSQLTDRRSAARLNAQGELQADRRADNRAANIESIRPVNTDESINTQTEQTPPPTNHQ